MSTLTDLNKHLFDQLDRLSAATSGENLEQEIARSAAVTSVSKEIISNASLRVQGIKLVAEYKGLQSSDVHTLLGKDS